MNAFNTGVSYPLFISSFFFNYSFTVKKGLTQWFASYFNTLGMGPHDEGGGRGGGGGGDRGSYSIPPKNHNFRICLPKKITTFLAYPKNPSVCFFPLKELVQSPYKLVDKQDTS